LFRFIRLKMYTYGRSERLLVALGGSRPKVRLS
jgi:hypothetical protein